VNPGFKISATTIFSGIETYKTLKNINVTQVQTLKSDADLEWKGCSSCSG
jgi:hypothetical protein